MKRPIHLLFAVRKEDIRPHGHAEFVERNARRGAVAMVASIGKIASPSQGVSYYEKDGYYAKDDPAHREASAWAGKGAEALGLSGPVEPEASRGPSS